MDVPLSHDPKCGLCGHSFHLLICEDHGVCLCDRSPAPGIDL